MTFARDFGASSAPWLTVVIPTFNGISHLATTLDSVLGQKDKAAFDVVVVDDGSTDGTAHLAEAHPVVTRVLRGDNRGAAVARNRGLAAASTPWVTFLDQDDLWHESRLARARAFLDSTPDCRLLLTAERSFAVVEEHEGLLNAEHGVGDWAEVQVPAGTELARLCGESTLLDVAGTDSVTVLSAGEVLQNTVSCTTSFFAERSLLQEAGGFAPWAWAHDDYVLLVAACMLTSLHRVDQPTALYRVHLKATSRSTDLALPFLLTNAALRNGGGVLGTNAAAFAELSDQRIVTHFLFDIARSGWKGAADAVAVSRFLRLPVGSARSLQRQLVEASLRRTARSAGLKGGKRPVK